MQKNNLKRNLVLGILFFLPVAFLLMLYPAKHNYTPLDIVNENVEEISKFSSESEEEIQLSEHITILAFLGKSPIDNKTAVFNLKELVYDSFIGFKKFQVVLVMPYGTETETEKLQKEIATYEDLRFWHYIYGSEEDIKSLYSSLKVENPLKNDLSTDDVFVIDKDLNQRGRIDNRTEKQIEAKKPILSLNAYNCIDVDIIKNKMSEDIRILFTEYRQKRKGQFNSTTRRADDLKK
ncbi:MAG: hypothetical protein HKP48_02410 [Winogradskyella sp.]|uniref:hypothetical protein n=1 Tax=Winogradskyella sp. TaxID=1883156 RepID=UPI00185A54EB|nr:hypothetical protein [Winogradskyella sp.]MBT8244993.1 hypothetical protein [Winogradskyella sp.]NNK22165.1 hypothetical protein [Winogradskyella sp.]